MRHMFFVLLYYNYCYNYILFTESKSEHFGDSHVNQVGYGRTLSVQDRPRTSGFAFSSSDAVEVHTSDGGFYTTQHRHKEQQDGSRGIHVTEVQPW